MYVLRQQKKQLNKTNLSMHLCHYNYCTSKAATESSRKISISVLAVWQLPVCLPFWLPPPHSLSPPHSIQCTAREQSQMRVAWRHTINNHGSTGGVTERWRAVFPPLFWQPWRHTHAKFIRLLLNRINFTRFHNKTTQSHTSKKNGKVVKQRCNHAQT